MDYSDKSLIDRTRSSSYQKYLREMMNKMRQDAEKSNPQTAFTSRMTEIISVEFYEKKNAIEHHTNKFGVVHSPTPSLVIRRGQPFKMALKFKGVYKPDDERVTLEFNFGHEPNRNKGSQVQLDIKDKKEFSHLPGVWDVKMDAVEEKQIKVQVQVPPTVGIGVWNLHVNVTPKKAGGATKKHKFDTSIYILFNPWCKDDTVYMENDDWKNEYILNDVGKLYYGTYVDYTARQWVYGQFQTSSLPASMYMLDLSGLLYNARSNPVRVARGISNVMNKASNIPGDTGVLLGKWAKDNNEYKDGTAPWAWTGSAPILDQFLKSNGTSVKYAQCWVFSGVCTSVCRAVGIPCRNITCFAAGHDSDETLTIDVMYDSSGNRLTNSADSIWNFHVWNEVWMTRLDLPAGYGGWQVIDGTPQEKSDGGYQLGPCSVLGIKRGQVGLLYDTLFVFSEVNADMVNWKLRDGGMGLDKMGVNKNYIGQLVITKKVGDFDDHGERRDALDITESYKYKEGTPEERMAVLNAARNAGKSQLFDMPDPRKEEIVFELIPVKNVMVGEDFEMALKIENKGKVRRTVLVVLCCCSVHYTGAIANKIKEEKKTISIPPGEKFERETTWMIEGPGYVDQLVEFGMIKIYCMTTVTETNQAWAGEQDFVLNKPKLLLELPSPLRRGQSYTLKVTFKNPYKKTLTECQFNAEGPGLLEYTQRDFRDIKELETVVQEFPITAVYKCQTAVVAVFSSKELSEITGSKQIKVTK